MDAGLIVTDIREAYRPIEYFDRHPTIETNQEGCTGNIVVYTNRNCSAKQRLISSQVLYYDWLHRTRWTDS